MDATIKEKIKELFETTPLEIGVSFGKKIVGNEYTDELSFVFMVPKKLPLNEIPQNEILPSSVEVNGLTYKTDVLEVGEIKLIACNPNTTNNCYGWQVTPPDNQNTIRPLKGGIQISSYNNSPNYPTEIITGTLGFIALDVATDAIVGVTNNHVVIKNPFYVNERISGTTHLDNELDDNVYQNGFDHSSGGTIGKVIRYVPIKKSPSINQVDGALVALYSNVVSFSESYLQYGLSISQPMEFATTTEINNALSGNYPIASSGRSTGAKIGNDCGLAINSLGAFINAGPYHDNNTDVNSLYDNIIAFTRINPDCEWPLFPGDSGSALLAQISGVWKIIGLCFAAGNTIGYASRIDDVASQLGIKSWDGTSKPFIDVNSKQVKAVLGASGDKTIDCNGTTYWQIGSDYNTNFCV